MSLFTSMMVTLYSAYVEKQTVYHMLETLKIRPQTSPDKRYSALISLPPPINVILVFFAPILLCTKNPELWNKVILWIAYLPVLCVSFILFILYTAALLPLSFVKLFFHKMIMIFMYSKSYRVHKSDKFMQWVIFAVIGLFRITANFFVDLIAFVKHCVMSDLKKTKVMLRQRPLSQHSLKMVAKYLQKRSERMIPMKFVSKESRN